MLDCVREKASDMESLLNTRMTSYGANYAKGSGIAPYDVITRKSHNRVMGGWHMSRRSAGISKDSISFQFRNNVPHAIYLYGKDDGNKIHRSGRNAGGRTGGLYLRSASNAKYRSAKNHIDPRRPNQLTATKWKQFKEYSLDELKKCIKINIKRIK